MLILTVSYINNSRKIIGVAFSDINNVDDFYFRIASDIFKLSCLRSGHIGY